MNPIISIIGAGNMGESIIAGLIHHHTLPQNIFVADQNTQRLQKLSEHYKIHATSNNVNAIENADVVLLAVKPNDLKSLAGEIKKNIQERHSLIISIAAGVSLSMLERYFGAQLGIVRCMPNTPALVGLGASALFANENVSLEQKQIAEKIFNSIGISIWLERESLIDAVTALSGSGPAYFFLFMECMAQIAVGMGLSESNAKRFAAQTAAGAAELAKHADFDFAQLQKNVASKGGTTEKALAVFKEEGLMTIIEKAMQAVKIRSEEMKTQFEEN